MICSVRASGVVHSEHARQLSRGHKLNESLSATKYSRAHSNESEVMCSKTVMLAHIQSQAPLCRSFPMRDYE